MSNQILQKQPLNSSEHSLPDNFDFLGKAREALEMEPFNAFIYEKVALHYFDNQDGELACAWIKEAIRYQYDVASFHYHYALILTSIGKEQQAMLEYNTALQLDPENTDAMWNCSELYRLNYDAKYALSLLLRILVLGKYYDCIYHRIAVCYDMLDDKEKAHEYYAKELENSIDNNHSLATKYIYSHSLLGSGDLKKGWEYYDKRHQYSLPGSIEINQYSYPFWKGESLLGKTLFIHSEQGYGDEIMFASIIPRLLEEGANIILSCKASLGRLFINSFPNIKVISNSSPENPVDLRGYESIDYQVPICSLARWRGPQAVTDSVPQNYIVSTNYRQRYFDNAIKAFINAGDKEKKLRVGLMWNANPLQDTRHTKFGKRSQRKSISFHEFSPLCQLANKVQFVSLQNHVSAEQCAELPCLNIMNFSDELNDFADTAALINCLDLVITIDTSVAHLAGGMGARTWTLLNKNPDFRWLKEGEKSYWYDNTKLFRQSKMGDWSDVIQSVIDELTLWVEAL